MIGTIICKVCIIICDISTITVRFYLLEIRYLHGYGYCRITLNYIFNSLWCSFPSLTSNRKLQQTKNEGGVN
jgi:hypothetical protein